MNTRCPKCGYITDNVFDCPTCKAREDGQVDPVHKQTHTDNAAFLRSVYVAAIQGYIMSHPGHDAYTAARFAKQVVFETARRLQIEAPPEYRDE